MEETLLEFRRKTEAYRTMNAELEILGVKLKHYRVDAAMEIAEEYLSNDKLNTIGIVTMQMLMQASKEPTWKQYIEDLDLTVIGETEVLEAAGIDPETPSYEEVETNEFIARFFWGLIQTKSRIFVLGDTEEELQTLQKYLTETYPGIEIGGGAVVETLEESAFDDGRDCERPCRNAAGSFRSGKQQQNQRKNLAEPWRAFDAAERGRYKNELVGNSAKEEYVQADGNKI